MKIKHIFFDFDGVLAESVSVKTEAFRKMYLDKGEEFSNKVVEFHLLNGGMSRYEKFKIFNGEWLGENITQERIDELAIRFSNLVVDGVVNSPEVTGTRKFLENSNNFSKYIITGTPTNEIDIILKRRAMDQFFLDICGSPEKKDFWVKKILKNRKIESENCVFVGDAMADYKAAIANNIVFVLRETKEAEHLFENYTGPRIQDMTQLNTIIKSLN